MLGSAFTLVELIVVITILTILATIGFLALSGYAQDARDSAVKANVRSVQSAISIESTISNFSPRYYVIHDPDYALSGALAYVDGTGTYLTGGNVGQPPTDSNYTAGKPDYVKLKLNPDKFKVSSSGLVPATFAAYDATSLMAGSADFLTSAQNGGKRTTSYFQVGAILPTTKIAQVSGNFLTAGVPAGYVSGFLRAEPGSGASNLTGSLVDGVSANASVTVVTDPVTVVPTVVGVAGDDSTGRKWSDASVALSCSGYLNAPVGKTYTGSTGNGTYWIDPDGTGGTSEYKAYCDMTTNGGGWTLVMNVDTSDGNVMPYENALWTNASSYGTVPSTLVNANDYKNGPAFTGFSGSQLLVTVHTEGTVVATSSYVLNEILKPLGYYFNKGSNTQLSQSVSASS